jgi:hypothetical protein
MHHDPLRSATLLPVGSQDRVGCWGLASMILLAAAAFCLLIGALFGTSDWGSIPLGILGTLLGLPAILLRVIPERSPSRASPPSERCP